MRVGLIQHEGKNEYSTKGGCENVLSALLKLLAFRTLSLSSFIK